MIFFEEEMDAYIEATSLFPHGTGNKEETMAMRARPQEYLPEDEKKLRQIYKALGLTAKGTFRKTAAEKRVEALVGPQPKVSLVCPDTSAAQCAIRILNKLQREKD